MCDLFGLSCNGKDRATQSLPVFGEFSIFEDNDDGWGIAYYEGNEAIIVKDTDTAIHSDLFHKTIKEARSNTIISHIRHATTGTSGTTTLCDNNCHPFQTSYAGKDWVFAHNGQIRNIEHHDESEGDTDSEQFFRRLIDEVAEYQRSGNVRGIYPGITKAMKKILANYNSNYTLNFFMSDGSMFYAFSHYPGKPIYFVQRTKRYGDAIVLSTQKLTDDEEWKPLPTGRLLMINRGDIITLSDKIV